jgi:flagella basal body P-ring formation protein FlgA
LIRRQKNPLFTFLLFTGWNNNGTVKKTTAMKKRLITICCLLSLYSPGVWAEAKQSHAEIRKVASEFIQAQTAGLSGKVVITVNNIDKRIALPACPQLEAYLPQGAQLHGKTNIGVRCNGNTKWSIFIPATIIVTINILVSNRPLTQGHTLTADDFSVQPGELNQTGIVSDENAALGKILKFSINAGQPLKQNMLRDPYAVLQGQTVQIISEGRGFKLRTEGLVLSNAADGQAVQVKVPSGQIINGFVKGNGIVEVRP